MGPRSRRSYDHGPVAEETTEMSSNDNTTLRTNSLLPYLGFYEIYPLQTYGTGLDSKPTLKRGDITTSPWCTVYLVLEYRRWCFGYRKIRSESDPLTALHAGLFAISPQGSEFYGAKKMDYENKLVLAPMVRVGTLPFRLLSAQYGADITYGEEIIDHKLVKCERQINESIGSTDFVEKGTKNVVFRTCHEERNRVVFQMGTSDAVRALSAAQIVCKDIAAVDINMGCPKSFSMSGGMGAALLAKPLLIHDILTTLKRNLSTPITCKIRLLKSTQDTVELARRIEKTGVSAIAVHGRRVADRPRDPAKWSEIADVVAALSIPVIANGDVFEYEDFQRFKVATGASSVMVARGALWNASIFSSKCKLPWEDVKREYVRKSILWDNDIRSTKHTLKEMITHYSSLELPEGKAVTRSETSADLAKLYGEEKYYQFVNENRSLLNGNRQIYYASMGDHYIQN
ncbi:hypothetical protein HHK36_009661 [Tetracentron sinense]|uniref:DUS-like FMN-binding domain-containing protein n=1 Tax=Tetracentron sinense TaxID=13715 RepID=A0A834ZD43_TETSI|nr:hypothetical protein HHK36_009661 [Tetracentron sinense]